MAKYQEKQRQFVLENGYILLNPITKHRAFIYDWDNLCKIDNELDSIEGRYGTYSNDSYTQDKISFVRKRLSESQKHAINYPIQHQGAMMFKLSAIMFFNYLKKNNLLFKVLYCVPCHDEHNVEAPEEITEEIADVLKRCMIKAGLPYCTRAPMDADVSIGDFWIH